MPGTSHQHWQFSPGPSPEVKRFLEQKALKPSFDWRDVWAEEHAIAFTVAKTTGFDVLEDIHEALRQAIEEGLPFAEFRKRLEPILRKKGWWGRKKVVDPLTGELRDAQLGSRRRLRTIYNANMRSARAAGQWERAQRTKRMLPYFEYRLGPSKQHRPHHEAWARAPTILPVDDPFWDTHYPPNGWGCKCWLRQISRREAARKGGPGESPVIEYRNWINRRTGEMEKIPVGIDPGWHTNPGKARARRTMERFFKHLEEAGKTPARQALLDFWRSGVWRAWIRMPERVHMPVALVPAAALELKAASDVVSISNDTLASKIKKHVKEKPPRVRRSVEAVLDTLPQLMEEAIYLGEMKPGQVWLVLEAGGLLWRVVVRKSAKGYMHIQTVHPTDHDHLIRWQNKKQ